MDYTSPEFRRLLQFFAESSRTERQEMINEFQKVHDRKIEDRKLELWNRVKGMFPSKSLQNGVDRICYKNHWFSFDTTETQVFIWETEQTRWLLSRSIKPIKISVGKSDDSALMLKLEAKLSQLIVAKLIES